ncbi:phosphopantetheine-binding protein [Kitasatospora mediocidica]|uniref:phosphopantetheine-binding protein n=1 Tax=Kitasatospora mediocidica TaxID=58352 RepID=UPI00055A825A|nr:phosphopantetheine-binding protein [Kitasatospora mediocidica]
MNSDLQQGDVPVRLATIWRDALSVEHISGESDFFELGGHSLLAIRVCVFAGEAFGVEVSSSELVIDSSFSAMVERIEAAQRDVAALRTDRPQQGVSA